MNHTNNQGDCTQTSKQQPSNSTDLLAMITSKTPTSTTVTREAVEALAKQEGQPVLDVLITLQSAAALLDGNEARLEALRAITSQILDEQAQKPKGPKFPDVNLKLSGQDGNVFLIIGRVRRALQRGGATEEDLKEFTDEINNSCSYDEALQTVMRWVEVS